MFGSSIAKPMSKVRVFGVLIAFWTGKDETVTAGSPGAFTFFTRISNGALGIGHHGAVPDVELHAYAGAREADDEYAERALATTVIGRLVLRRDQRQGIPRAGRSRCVAAEDATLLARLHVMAPGRSVVSLPIKAPHGAGAIDNGAAVPDRSRGSKAHGSAHRATSSRHAAIIRGNAGPWDGCCMSEQDGVAQGAM